jgi:hypothetical protein
MLDGLPDWLQATGALMAGGGLSALVVRHLLVKFISSGIDMKALEVHSDIYAQMQAQMQRLQSEHFKMSESLNSANALLVSVQRQLVHMDVMLTKMHALLISNGIDVPNDVQVHLMREVI